MKDITTVPQFNTLIIEIEGDIAYLILNAPKKYNALGSTLLKELVVAAKWFDTQRAIKVVIVKGAGQVFSAGADLKDPIYADMDKVDWLTRREMGQLGYDMAQAIESMRAVTIAQVEKFAIGGGLVLMMACDLRIAATGTIFSIPEVDLGIPLAWGGIPKLVREIGPAMTKELVMTCRRFTPEEALSMQILNRVVPQEELEKTCLSLALSISQKPHVPIVITKEHVNAVVSSMGKDSSSRADGDVLNGITKDPDAVKAMETYIQKMFRNGR
jgi:enoyl-CoA hydratase/carnithine racemase